MPGSSPETLPSRSQSGPCKKGLPNLKAQPLGEQPHRTQEHARGPAMGFALIEQPPSRGKRGRGRGRGRRARDPVKTPGPDEGRKVPA